MRPGHRFPRQWPFCPGCESVALLTYSLWRSALGYQASSQTPESVGPYTCTGRGNSHVPGCRKSTKEYLIILDIRFFNVILRDQWPWSSKAQTQFSIIFFVLFVKASVLSFCLEHAFHMTQSHLTY